MMIVKPLDKVSPELFEMLTDYSRKDYEYSAGTLAFQSSHLWLVSRDDEPMFIVGLQDGSLLSGKIIWLLVCKALKQHSIEVIRWSRRHIPRTVELLGPLLVYVEDRHAPAKRFAQLIGFKPSVRVNTLQGTAIMCEAS